MFNDKLVGRKHSEKSDVSREMHLSRGGVGIMKTVRLTMAQALVRYLCSQKTEIDGRIETLFAGVFGIFGHGNVTCLAEALESVQDKLPTWRGQNEQSMALAGAAYAKAMLRRRF